MTFLVFASVLVAAALHASWNALIKSGDDKALTTIMVATSAALFGAAVTPFLTLPDRASWPFLAASVVVHVLYFALVASAYKVADMGQTYPLMRGTAPFLVALTSVLWLGESSPLGAWFGVALISFGILTMTRESRHGAASGVILALLNAVVIAGYTLIDGEGTRRSGSPEAYACWVFMLNGVPLIAWVLMRNRAAFARLFRAQWRVGLIGGSATAISYAIVLAAMTKAPVAMVAALRETSILFGTAIAGLILREHIGPARMIGAGLIGLGVVALRLA
ncbi:MAG: EamA family transporter [Proteobacteria bacterium]|nr:EamA family transporter [Pseudomonadota bacterium]